MTDLMDALGMTADDLAGDACVNCGGVADLDTGHGPMCTGCDEAFADYYDAPEDVSIPEEG